MNRIGLRFQRLSDAGGWRRLFIAGTAWLFMASFFWSWYMPWVNADGREFVELALALWSIGSIALGILVVGLALADHVCVWVGGGFGLCPMTARSGAVVAVGMVISLGALAVLTRYETVMPESGSMRTGDLCVVLDRWTGEAKPCTEEAIIRHYRKRSEPLRASEPSREQTVWREVVGILAELLEIARKLPLLVARV